MSVMKCKYIVNMCVQNVSTYKKTEDSSILSCSASDSSTIQWEKTVLQELFIYMHTCNISIFSMNLARHFSPFKDTL